MRVDTSGWPLVVGTVERQFSAAGSWVLQPEAVADAFRVLSSGAEPRPQPSFIDLLTPWAQPFWLRLDEVALDTPRAVMMAKLVAALSRLSAGAGELGFILNIGTNGDGDAGLTVGLPPLDRVTESWCAGLATELIFEGGLSSDKEVQPFGWRALAGSPHEHAVVGISVPTMIERQPGEEQRPTSLELLLGAGGSLPPWSVDLALRPLPDSSPAAMQSRVLDLVLQAGQTVSRTSARNETDSTTFTDVRAERVLESLKQWQTLADDCVRVGGWSVSIRVRASSAADLAAVTAAFRGSLGDDVHVTHPTRRQFWSIAPVGPAVEAVPTWLSSRDVADLMLFGGQSVGQIQTRRPLASGRQMHTGTRPIDLGTWFGTNVPARIDLDDLGAHAFIAGITGSGKSTTTRTLLAQVSNDYRIPFLVIDPAKTDYADFGEHLESDLRVIQGRDLKMNVLRAWPGRDPSQHIARVSNAFRGSFAMPSPVPYIVSILLEELAQEARHSEVSLHDAWSRLDSLIDELRYRGEIEDNIKASLGLRLRLLLQPSRADRVACVGSVPEWLTESPTVVQLGDIADEEERNFLASMLVLYVSDAARARGLSDEVRHLTVIEEAHRLMPEPKAVGAEEGDSGSVSAKLMSQLLAEIRAYGESLLIIDQSPAAVAREVLRNTNVKLVHRIVDRDDQQVLGGALGLDEEASPMLGSLKVGRMLISSRNLVQPQTAQVRGDLPSFAHQARPETKQSSAYVCHNDLRAPGHHVAERHGQEMQLLVGLWSLGHGGDLRVLAQRLVEQDPGTNASCLIRIGLRRYVNTLYRIAYVKHSEVAETVESLWRAAVRGDPAPPPPRSQQRPFGACAQCPDPCTARGIIVSRTLQAYRRSQASLARATQVEQMMNVIFEASTAVGDEVGAGRSTATIIACAQAHLAEQVGLGAKLYAELRGGA